MENNEQKNKMAVEKKSMFATFKEKCEQKKQDRERNQQILRDFDIQIAEVSRQLSLIDPKTADEATLKYYDEAMSWRKEAIAQRNARTKPLDDKIVAAVPGTLALAGTIGLGVLEFRGHPITSRNVPKPKF